MSTPPASAAGSPPPVPSPAPASGSKPKPLTRRQEKFCGHYALTGNAAESARFAGYAARSAANQGFRLLRDLRVRDRVYTVRVNEAMRFGPVVAFARLENLFRKASAKGDFRAAAHILTLQARLAGVESWTPPSVVVREAQGGARRSGRGALGPKGPDPFDNICESEWPDAPQNDDE